MNDRPLQTAATTAPAPVRARARRATLRPGQAARYGFAPDLDHGPRPIAAIYDFEPCRLVEGTVFATVLAAPGDHRALITLGRFVAGFFDIIQLVTDADTTDLDPTAAALFEGMLRLVCPTGFDAAALQRLLARCGRTDLAIEVGRCAELPIAASRARFHHSELLRLGIGRNMEPSLIEIELLIRDGFFAHPDDLDPEAARAVLAIGRCDVLSCLAVHTDALIGAIRRSHVHTEQTLHRAAAPSFALAL